MILKKLELQGFKSFANKTVIEFEDGITAVVGPNGSGKSNISDSVRWVLGEQSAKTLRGEKMEDIIFNGTDKKSPLGFAEVTLTLNNKEGIFPIDYDEVAVTRRIFRDGDSEFYINKKACRLKDIRELFMDTGIGRDGYSIISQGRIDEILSTKSEDRRNIFEEAAGITKYKFRKLESERKLNRTKENLIRIEDIILEIEAQIDPLKVQSKKAEEYIELSSSLKNSEVELLSNQIQNYKEKEAELEKIVDKLDKSKSDIDKRENLLDRKYDDIKLKISEVDKSLNSENERRYEFISKRDRYKSDIYLYNQKNENNRSYKKRTELDIAEIDIQVEEAEISINEKKISSEDLDKDLKSKKSDLEKSRTDIEKFNKNVLDIQKELEISKSALIENLNKISEHKMNISNIDTHISLFDTRKSKIDENYSEIVKNTEDTTILSAQIEKEADSKKKQIELIRQKVLEQTEKLEELKKSFQTDLNEYNGIRNSSERKMSSYNILKDMQEDYEGYYKGVKNFLIRVKYTELKIGVEGVVAELINVDKRFEKSIEVALGGSLQNIVTTNTEYAKKSIDFLKQHRLGRITFLPLDNIRSRYLNDREKSVLNENGVLGVASQLIDYDQKYRNIFEYILGKTIIVDNIDNMIKISRKYSNTYKMVTLDGDVMNPGGSMTGGSFRGNTLSLLGRGRQLEDLKVEITELRNRFKELSEKLEKTKSEIDIKENGLQNNHSQLNALGLEENDIRNRLLSIKGREESFIIQKKEYDDEIIQINIEKEKLDKQKKDIEESITSITLENSMIKESNKKTSDELANKNRELESMREAYVSEQIVIASIEENLKNIVNSIEESLKDIDRLKDRKVNFSIRIENIDKEISETEMDITNTEKSIEETNSQIAIMDDLILSLKSSKEELNNEMNQIERERESVKKDKENLVEDLNKKNIDYERVSMQLESVKSKLWEDYQMSMIMAEQCDKSGKSDRELKVDVNGLKKKIRALGNVNLDSIEELKIISERYDFMSKQKNDLIEAEKSLKYVIKEMNSRMKEQFTEKFHTIREEFKIVFKELFNGGRADIYIEDEDDILNSGIEIVAEPPGKKLQSLSLLSGGERALTAISLLFAILKTKPTPFSILDEIEAALDEANVYRYAEYLKKFSKESQFVVVTHRKGTMESADSIYGVTMQRNGISELISLKLNEI